MSEIQQLQEEINMGFGAEETTNIFFDNQKLAAVIKNMLELQLQVKEELERIEERFFTKEKRKSGDEGHISNVRQLELRFSEEISVPVYTGKEIKGEGENHLTLALVDPITGSRVLSGPEASAKVEIMVLTEDDRDFDGNFTHEGSQNTGRPLLSRNHVVLKEGIAVLDNFKFKNKSKWTKSCKVSLAARISNRDGIAVKEAATEEFLVMDHRSTLYKKHYPPSLCDEVWRVEKIRRGSQLQKDLNKANINTVEEFLRLLNMNPESLKAILNVSPEKFKIIADHAQTCPIGEKIYLYSSTSSQRKARVVFNTVGLLKGLLYEDNYVHIEKLSEDEKVDAHKIMVSAFENLDEAESFENEASIALFISRSSNANGAETSSSPRIENAADNTFGTGDWNGEIDIAFPSIVPLHLSPPCPFSTDILDTYDSFTSDYMDIYSREFDYPIHSRSVSEEFGENQQLQFLLEQCSHETSTASNQMTGTSIDPSSMARQRWQMAIGIIALADMHARKRQRLH